MNFKNKDLIVPFHLLKESDGECLFLMFWEEYPRGEIEILLLIQMYYTHVKQFSSFYWSLFSFVFREKIQEMKKSKRILCVMWWEYYCFSFVPYWQKKWKKRFAWWTGQKRVSKGKETKLLTCENSREKEKKFFLCWQCLCFHFVFSSCFSVLWSSIELVGFEL